MTVGSLPGPIQHVGVHVADLEAGIEEYSAFGADLWHRLPAPARLFTYDARVAATAPVDMRIALGRLSDTMLVELIEPIGGPGAVGHPSLLGEHGGVSHIGAWSSDLPDSYRALAARGARLLLASDYDAGRLAELEAAGDDADAIAAALAPLSTFYVIWPQGTVLEMLHVSMWKGAYTNVAPGLVNIMIPPTGGETETA